MAERTLTVRLLGDSKDLERAFAKGSKSAKGFDNNIGKAGRGALAASVSFKGLGRSIGFASNAFLGGAGVVFGIKAVSAAASNLAEQTTKTEQVFGSASKTVQSFSKNALGLAEDQALQTASSIGALLIPLGLTGKSAADLSVRLTNLGTDFASFFNTDTADALQAIQSGLVGEVEPLRRFGVLLSETRVQQEALAETGKKSAKALTAQEKVQARVALIFRDSAQAQGDFARTQGGLANQQRDLAKNVRNLEIAIGTALNPTILNVTTSLNKWLSKSGNLERVQRDVADGVDIARKAFGDIKGVIEGVDRVTGGLKNTLEILLGLKVVSTLAKWSGGFKGLAASMGAGAAGNAAGGAAGGGAAGGISKLLTAAKGLAELGVIALAIKFPGLAKAGNQLLKFTASLSKVALTRLAIPVTFAFVAEKAGLNKFVPDLLKQLKTGGGNGSLSRRVENLFYGSAGHRGFLGNLLTRGNEAGQSFAKGMLQGIQNFTGVSEAAETLATKVGTQAARAAASRAQFAPDTATDLPKRRGLTADQRNTFFDNDISRILLRGGLGDIQQQIAALQRANSLISARLKVTKDLTRRLTLEDELLQNSAQIKSLQADAAATALSNAADALSKRQDAMAEFIANLQLGVTRAQATATFTDDITALQALQKGIRAQIKEFGLTADLAGQLFDAQQNLTQARLQQRTARQFRELGLTETGDEITPGVKNLQKRLKQLTGNIAGTNLDTPKLRTQLARFRKVLGEKLTPPNQEVRAKIKSMMDTIADELKNSGKRNQTKFRKASLSGLLSGLGLSPEEKRRLSPRLAALGAGGTVPGTRSVAFSGAGTVAVTSPVYLDGVLVSRNTTKHQQLADKRKPSSRRGTYAGRH